jgi:hypothetical protein
MLVHNTVDGHLYQWCIDVDRNQLTGVDLALNLWATVGLELVPGYEASAWLGFGAPKDTPAAIVGMLGERGPRRPGDQDADRRLGRNGACNFASRVRQAHNR